RSRARPAGPCAANDPLDQGSFGGSFLNADLRRLTKALLFAAEQPRNQRRKGAAQEPYLNHLVEVLDLVVQASEGTDMDIVVAALLHDVVEDTSTSYEDVAENFG